MTTKIEWTRGDDGTPGVTWNPTRGCRIYSKGCSSCYAMKQAHRFSGAGRAYEGLTKLTSGGPVWTGVVRPAPEMLEAPLHWKKPRRVFVDSMSDLFYGDEADRVWCEKQGVPFTPVPDEFIDQVFAVMALCPQHTFQLLTKRAERMRQYVTRLVEDDSGNAMESLCDAAVQITRSPCAAHIEDVTLPLSNVWLMVSAEDQATFDERVPHLLATPAAVRGVSLEPLLSGIDIAWSVSRNPLDIAAGFLARGRFSPGLETLRPLDWVIVGGESGPGARPCDVTWIRSIVAQCKAAGVPAFVKQLGAEPRGWCAFHTPECIGDEDATRCLAENYCDAYEASEIGQPCEDFGKRCLALHDRKGGDITEFPEDLRVREFPRVTP